MVVIKIIIIPILKHTVLISILANIQIIQTVTLILKIIIVILVVLIMRNKEAY